MGGWAEGLACADLGARPPSALAEITNCCQLCYAGKYGFGGFDGLPLVKTHAILKIKLACAIQWTYLYIIVIIVCSFIFFDPCFKTKNVLIKLIISILNNNNLWIKLISIWKISFFQLYQSITSQYNMKRCFFKYLYRTHLRENYWKELTLYLWFTV
jgi:hypothetical protein